MDKVIEFILAIVGIICAGVVGVLILCFYLASFILPFLLVGCALKFMFF